MGDDLNLDVSKSRIQDKEYVLDAVLLLIIVQIARITLKYIFLSQLNFTYENVNIANIISIMLVGISLAHFLRGNNRFNPAGQRLTNLNNKYHNKNTRIILGILAGLGILVSYFLEGGAFFTTLVILSLSLIVEPIFEEVIFRDFLWNYMSNYQKDEKKILINISILSALFKIGYWDIISQNLNVVGSSFYTVDIIFSKVIFGLIFAFILGIVRMKFKDTYICIFLHSLINVLFGN